MIPFNGHEDWELDGGQCVLRIFIALWKELPSFCRRFSVKMNSVPFDILLGTMPTQQSMLVKTKVICGWLILAALFCSMVGTLAGATSGNFTYVDNGTTITITGYPQNGVGVVTIPPTIIGKSVTSIGNLAFSGCAGLTTVTMPSAVTSIGSSAFSGCTGLTSMTIPARVATIASDAFTACTGLTTFIVDASNPNYGSSAGVIFNKSLSSVIQYPKGKAGPYTVPTGVTSIGSSAFSGCTGLSRVVIPASVTSIGSSAFSSCTGLASVAIPANVLSLSDNAFGGCSGLLNVEFTGDAPSMGIGVFDNASSIFSVIYHGCPVN
ncbi:MAG: leucine-rich repeat domain-containing protein [Terrimicrobiaceae bacterium]